MNQFEANEIIATLVCAPDNWDDIFQENNLVKRTVGHESFTVKVISSDNEDDCFEGIVIESNMPEMKVNYQNSFAKGFFKQA